MNPEEQTSSDNDSTIEVTFLCRVTLDRRQA